MVVPIDDKLRIAWSENNILYIPLIAYSRVSVYNCDFKVSNRINPQSAENKHQVLMLSSKFRLADIVSEDD